MTGRELFEIRQRLGMSQPEMARTLGVHVNTLGRWERGQNRIPFTTAEYAKSLAIVERSTLVAMGEERDLRTLD